ncbi:helix-turn-helix transcriptional regulator [Myxosarcina sp. GI1(2024)]
MALQFDAIATKRDYPKLSSQLKPTTVNQIYHARDILHRTYDNPPSIIELARIVGISDRTLQRGFRQLFDMTVIGYITFLRIQQAEKLLRSGNVSVAEVANLVGYSHLGHFAAAFKRQFSITPSECLAGKLGKWKTTPNY